MANRDRRDQKFSTYSTVGGDAKKGGAGGSYTWGSALDVPTDYVPTYAAPEQVQVSAAARVVQSAPMVVLPMTVNIGDNQAFPTLGAPAQPVTIRGWGPGSQGQVVYQQPVETLAPVRTTVEFGATHPRNTFARIPRTSTGGSVVAAQPAAIDWSAPGTAAMNQAVIQATGNPAHLGPYTVAAAPVAVQTLKQQPVYQQIPKPVSYVQSRPNFMPQKVTQARGR
eukprot:TRINITY_DN700_c0_g1_i1.p1 TRINITY_DN700_c0_g1~~TRINITY_DN700_c0_g1_i1.p1  ORF type:complete len:224 (+),score=33.89 TRINITY_DN700_c0_g1_i1:87-758(+)